MSNLGPRNLVLYAGQVIRGKGVDLLLRALAKVPTGFECLIFGDGNHRRSCERLSTKLGLGNQVQFRGFAPAAEIREHYLQASVFAVSSVWPEPFGMVGPEAMLYGLPVVAFSSGGISEWLTDQENGFLVPWMDTDRFASRIDELLRNKALAREMGHRGFERVVREYDPCVQIGKLEKIFDGLCGAQARPARPVVNDFSESLVADPVNI